MTTMSFVEGASEIGEFNFVAKEMEFATMVNTHVTIPMPPSSQPVGSSADQYPPCLIPGGEQRQDRRHEAGSWPGV